MLQEEHSRQKAQAWKAECRGLQRSGQRGKGAQLLGEDEEGRKRGQVGLSGL